MRPPPKLDTPPAQLAGYAISGLVLLIVGVVSEFIIRPRPIVPISAIPHVALLCAGAGFGLALFDRYFPKFGNIAYTLVAVGVFLLQSINGYSALPLMLLAGLFYLLRAVLRVALLDD